ncbi:hypothetical protein JCM10207_000526 [Rhodosporidiobolus poonsookiae]
MCRAVTSISYGIAVRTFPLLFAADAFPKVEPVLRFFSLLALRIKRGTLSTTTGEAVKRVPLEVWELVKEKLVGQEVKDKEEDFVESMGCSVRFGCPGGCCPPVGGGKAPEYRWENVACEDRCEMCDERFFDFFDDILAPSCYGKRVDKLLLAFGLSLGSLAVLKQDDADHFELGCATFLSVPLSEYTDSALDARWGGDAEPNGVATATLPSSVPHNARARFFHLVKLMRLEVLDISESASPPVWKEQATGRHRVLKKGGVRRFKTLKLSEVEPHWQVQTTCVDN